MTGRADSISVFLKLYGAKKFAKEVTASGAELEAMGLKGAKAMSRFATSSERLKSLGRSWTRNISLPIAGIGAAAVMMSLNFNKSMLLIETHTDTSRKMAERYKGTIESMASSGKFTQGPKELAEAMYHIASDGYKGARAINTLKQAAHLATLGQSGMAETTYALVSAMKTGIKGTGNLHKAIGLLNGIVGAGDMNMQEFQASLSTGILPVAKSVGISLKDVGAAMDVLTQRGMPAQQSATKLRMNFAMLAPYTSKAAAAFEALGLGQDQLVNKLHGPTGLFDALTVLKEHLNKFNKNKQRTFIMELFGGGRSSTGMLTLLQNLGSMKKSYAEIGSIAAKTGKNLKHALASPSQQWHIVWAQLQAALIGVGNVLVPVVIPALKAVVPLVSGLAKSFIGLPSSVKAVGLGFLLLTGPVLSGLGYFAGGVGRILVLTMKLAGAAKSAQIFFSAMSAGQGIMGSSSIAFGSGITAAKEMASGLALTLGGAVAAYGIGNILTSALSGDWKEAGFEAGGAIAGGIAGFMVGGPLGAMLGVGIGSLGGELLSGLFGSSQKLGPLQAKLAGSNSELTNQLKRQRTASEGLSTANNRLQGAHKRQNKATWALSQAQARLSLVTELYGPHSRPAIHAAAVLTGKLNAQREAIRKLRNAEQLHGVALKAYKTETNATILAERHRVNVLESLRSRQARLFELARKANPTSERTQSLAHALLGTEGKLAEAHKKQAQTLSEASEKAGGKYANFLTHARRSGLEWGKQLQHITERVAKLKSGIEGLNEVPLSLPSTLPGAPGSPLNPRGPIHRRQGSGHHRKTATGAGRPSVKKLTAGGLNGAFHVAVQNVNTLLLDGQEVANNTTHHVAAAAARA